MSKTIDKIVIDKEAPKQGNVAWVNPENSVLKVFNNGTWQPIGKTVPTTLKLNGYLDDLESCSFQEALDILGVTESDLFNLIKENVGSIQIEEKTGSTYIMSVTGFYRNESDFRVQFIRTSWDDSLMCYADYGLEIYINGDTKFIRSVSY